MKALQKGDYVLATKYADGDPLDQWCIGFYDQAVEVTGGSIRHLVVDSDGAQFRHNGFRRVKKIRGDVGEALLNNIDFIGYGGRSLYSHELAVRKLINNSAQDGQSIYKF